MLKWPHIVLFLLKTTTTGLKPNLYIAHSFTILNMMYQMKQFNFCMKILFTAVFLKKNVWDSYGSFLVYVSCHVIIKKTMLHVINHVDDLLQSKLTRLFSRMLLAKRRVKPEIARSTQLDAFPNTAQWLQIVGVSSRVAKVSSCLLQLLCLCIQVMA